MRLIVTVLWLIAAALWLPWALLALRLGIDLLLSAIPATAHLGHPLATSPYLTPVLEPLVITGRWPYWDEHRRFIAGWADVHIGSMYPWAALAGCALTALGWRLYWIAEDGLLRHGARAIVASILFPPLASVLMFRDALARYRAAENDLAGARQDALKRLGRDAR